MTTRLILATANTPGAVAILQLHGDTAADTLHQFTGHDAWPPGRVRLCRFAGIDEGLAVLITPGAAQLMPHGGPRVVQKLIEHLTGQLGVRYDPSPDPRAMYPEAGSPIDADLLDAIARAASPAAIDLLAAQPKLWRALLKQGGGDDEQRRVIADRSRTLDRLIVPPTVVVVGPANAGKSTLTNALMGRSVSLVADLPGTTRDWVGGLVELSSGSTAEAIAVHWLDTPGLRDSDDPIEQRAIALAKQQIERADVLIAMRGADQPWANADALPRDPDVWVVNKIDHLSAVPPADSGRAREAALPISALHGIGLDTLQNLVIERLGLADLPHESRWAFSESLVRRCEHPDQHALTLYLGV